MYFSCRHIGPVKKYINISGSNSHLALPFKVWLTFKDFLTAEITVEEQSGLLGKTYGKRPDGIIPWKSARCVMWNVKPRLHQIHKYPGQATCIRIHVDKYRRNAVLTTISSPIQDTCRGRQGIQVDTHAALQ